MPISKRQAHALYNCENAEDKPDSGKVHKLSNWDLLRNVSQGNFPEQFAAAVFLRPKMAMRYKLLPALAMQLDHARPIGPQAFPVKTPEEKLRRSLALILELADENWTELPRTWGYLGSALETMDIDLAQAAIESILHKSAVPDPMEFLKKFAEPVTENTVWKRFYWLSDADLEEFRNEREETLKRINEEDSETAEALD